MRHSHQKRILTTLILPAFLFMIVLFLLPLLFTLADSVLDEGNRLSLADYIKFFQNSKSSSIYWRTLRIAFIVSTLTIIFGYPAAWMISRGI